MVVKKLEHVLGHPLRSVLGHPLRSVLGHLGMLILGRSQTVLGMLGPDHLLRPMLGLQGHIIGQHIIILRNGSMATLVVQVLLVTQVS